MDLIANKTDLTFDSGPQPISTGAAMQTIGRIQPRGRRTLVALIIGNAATIGHIQILQSAFVDDPSPQPIGLDTALNSAVALADLSYVIPAVAIPLAAGSVTQFHLQGDAAEYIFQASTASGVGGTAQIKGSYSKASENR